MYSSFTVDYSEVEKCLVWEMMSPAVDAVRLWHVLLMTDVIVFFFFRAVSSSFQQTNDDTRLWAVFDFSISCISHDTKRQQNNKTILQMNFLGTAQI